ncbi:MAG: hypothetical protein D6763_11995 [Alphaproteobacteria bacterium]|nr:MAG: hypothetical protein D6763_11995 [Alphaproteobacteria bacterium]
MSERVPGRTALDRFIERCDVGWNAWPGTAIASVLIDRSWRHPIRGYGTESFWGIVGSRCVTSAWSGMAVTRDAVWISNGGHADYGGNEWYAFHFAQGEWRRETHPSRLVPAVVIPRKNGPPVKLPVPDDGRPLRGHVYGSPVVLSDGRILTINPVPFCQVGIMYFDDYVQNAWIFDPQTLDEVPATLDIVGLGGCARLGNNNILFGSSRNMRVVDAGVTRILDRHSGSLGFACGYDPVSRIAVGGLWSPRIGVATLDETETRIASYRSVQAPVRLTYCAVLVCGEGRFALIGADGDVWLYDALRDEWQQRRYPGAPPTRLVNNKIQWVPGRDVAICVPHQPTDPVHILKPDFPVDV